ncbi:MAG: hypothetical protein NTZ05_03820, partial [Chloroflexi bacterium]|nr:hypothetical protein [Chloroflexota bacterium]
GDTAPGPDEYEIEIEDVQRTRPRRRGLLLVFGRLLWGAGPAPRAEVQIVSADGTITHARNVSFGVFAKPPEEGPNRIHLVLGEVTWEGLRAGDRIREPAE